MTIAEKSTELGIDLAQLALNNYPIKKCYKDGVFHCFEVDKETPIFITDNNGVNLHQGSFRWSDETLLENTTTEIVEQSFKDYINSQEFKPVDTTVLTYVDLV